MPNETMNYININILKDYLERDILKEYLYLLDVTSLYKAKNQLEQTDTTESEKTILNLINEEIQNKAKERVTVRTFYDNDELVFLFPGRNGNHLRTNKVTLSYFLAHHKLTEYLQTLTDEELEWAKSRVLINSMFDDPSDLLSTIQIEQEYRAQAKAEQNQKVVK